jgi:anaerobic selenocysteine-containing dehydrogenase
VDLGALQPELPLVLGTPSGRIELAPELVMGDLPRLQARIDAPAPSLTLIGRRQLRSNNSWMHNMPSLIKGPERCLLLIHPEDALAHSLTNGDQCRVTSRVGDVTCKVQVTEELMPGVVSLPHGWGHDEESVQLGVAKAHPGVNVNRLSDDAFLDVPSANAAFNGVPVTLARV